MKRLKDELPEESFEASLLAADAGGEPPEGPRRRALDAALRVVALGGGSALVAGKAAAAATAGAAATGGGGAAGATGAALAGWKILAVVAIVGGAAVGGAVAVTRTTDVAPSESATSSPSAPVPLARPEPAPPDTQSAAPPPMLAAPAPAPIHVDTPKVAVPSVPSTVPSSAPVFDLAGEVRAIDRARAALAGRDTGETLAALDDYDRRYPAGSLAREAAVLRVEALALRGDHAEAARRAQELLAASPEGPYRARLRKVIDGAAASSP